jgi:Cu(I)/Ag(I) efflux system membrane protein CusA/SilA
VGGFVKQDQVDFDPNALVTYNLSIKDIASAIQASNNDVGGKTLEIVQFYNTLLRRKNHPNPLS